MAFYLIVHDRFANYHPGQMITDPDEVARILAGPNEGAVRRINAEGDNHVGAPAPVAPVASVSVAAKGE